MHLHKTHTRAPDNFKCFSICIFFLFIPFNWLFTSFTPSLSSHMRRLLRKRGPEVDWTKRNEKRIISAYLSTDTLSTHVCMAKRWKNCNFKIAIFTFLQYPFFFRLCALISSAVYWIVCFSVTFQYKTQAKKENLWFDFGLCGDSVFTLPPPPQGQLKTKVKQH